MKTFVILAAIVGVVLGESNPVIKYNGSRIVHGRPAAITDLPYQASVLVNMRPICGGSIINDHIVLTAAHCTNGQSASGFGVHVGDTNVLEVRYGQYVQVSYIVQHEQYNPTTINNDMSLLILSKRLSFNVGVQPITLDPRQPSVGSLATVSGWGTTSEGGSISTTLQQVDVPIFDKASCNADYGGKLTDQMLCAGYTEGYYDSCQGDSGGPLALNNKLIGVVSFGRGCAKPNFPGVYASVANMYNWLNTNINNN